MRVNETANEIEHIYDSVNELASFGLKHLDTYLSGDSLREKWHGVSSRKDVIKLTTEGWTEEAATAMDIATEAVETVEREHEMTGFHPVWDVAGCEVDVARYLAHEPENMIDYEIVPTTRAGRVIVLCASTMYSGSQSVDSVKRRGQAIAALAFALSRLGFATELWADMSVTSNDKRFAGRSRVLVKGPNDDLDPAQIMFAYSHPAMLRTLGLPVMHEMPERFHGPLRVGGGYGRVADAKRDLPEGTIYLPSLRSDHDIPNSDEFLLQYLRELGILTD